MMHWHIKTRTHLSKNIRDLALSLCNQYLEGKIDKRNIQSFAQSCIVDIDEITDDEILMNTIYEWEDEYLNYPITKRNIELWKLRLETGEDQLEVHNNWNVHISSQKSLCEKYNSDWSPANKKWKIGVNLSNHNNPINGLRHPKSKGHEGWYIWSGDYKANDDFFKPICIEHLLQLDPKIIKYLGLKEGFRFLIDDKGYEDVWFDEKLLNIKI